MARRYDSSTTTFSPEGRLHQVRLYIVTWLSLVMLLLCLARVSLYDLDSPESTCLLFYLFVSWALALLPFLYRLNTPLKPSTMPVPVLEF
jgi:hypothetical protein